MPIFYIHPGNECPNDKITAQEIAMTPTLKEFTDYTEPNDNVQIIIVEPNKYILANDIKAIYNNDTGCWECCSHCLNPKGYARFERNGNYESVHRYVYKLFYGDPGPEYVVRHSCDKPSCINPLHLLKGTQLNNMQDKVDRGRQARGETHGQAKLNNEDVICILADDRSTHKELAARFGVSENNIYLIKSGKIWKHLSQRNDSILDQAA